MNPEIKKFIESFREKPVKQFSINDFRTKAGNISFNKLLKEHNHAEIKRIFGNLGLVLIAAKHYLNLNKIRE